MVFMSVMLKTKQNAFTIIELLVAMGLLVMMLSLSGLIFNTTVKTHRAASATVDISRHLTAVTSQITSDLSGLQKNAPLFIWFDHRANNSRFDAIHFFANGDFQTTKQYRVRWDSDGDGVLENTDNFRDETIRGTVARIYYGHANSVDFLNSSPASADFATFQVLARKAHLLTSYDALTFDTGEIPVVTGAPMYAPFATSFGLQKNPNPNLKYTLENSWEFNTITLDQWINALNYRNVGIPVNANHFVDNCMDDDSRPYISLPDDQTLHLLMAQGVLSFAVQWAYTVDDLSSTADVDTPITGGAAYFTGLRWWPSSDPAGDGSVGSDFSLMGSAFGSYFSLPNGVLSGTWSRVKPLATETPAQKAMRRCKTINAATYFGQDFYPKALKFTFTLRDGNGFFADGKTFTHIVYLDNRGL
jgi:type II secretory pathway pseudopilin PulG